MKLSLNPFKKTTKAQRVRKTCQQCDTVFDCAGCADTTHACWCMRYPTALTCDIAEGADCMCPNCLTAVANEHISTQVDTVAVHTYQPIQAKHYVAQHGLTPLIENIDYQINKQGNWVLSRWFLLKKGKCCGSACQNCPYGHVNVTVKSRNTP